MPAVWPVIAKGTPPPSDITDDEIAQWRAQEDERRRLAQFDGWERPTEFSTYELPAFPLEALPPVLSDFVKAEAEFSQTPPDMAAMLSLAACAAALGKAVVCEVKPGYREPVNLFVAVVLPPGERKSAVLNSVTAPLEKWERKETERLKPQIAYSIMKAKMIEKQIDNQMRIFSKAKSKGQEETAEAEIQRLTENLSAQKAVLPPKVLCDDSTVEALVSLLAAQGGRAAQFSAEGGVFGMLAGRYSDKTSLDVYLKGHSGDNIRVDRKGRASEFVDSPALTLGLAVQPSVLESLADNPEFRGVGLLARFLFSIPTSKIGRRKVDTPSVPESIRAAYESAIERMLTLPRAFSDQLLVLKMNKGARDLFFEFSEWIEPQLAEFAPFESIRDWAAKLAGVVTRISAILSILRILRILALDNQIAISSIYLGVDVEAMTSAIAIGKYLAKHAMAAFSAMGLDEKTGSAQVLLRFIGQHEWKTFTHRDIQQAVKHTVRFREIEQLDKALSILTEHGFIRHLPAEKKTGPGRPAGASFEVNPFFNLAGQNPFNPQNANSSGNGHSPMGSP